MLVHDFCHADSPRVRGKRVLHSFEVVRTATKLAFDVVVRLVTDSEANVPIVVHSEGVSFIVVHPHRICLVDIRERSAPVVVLVVVVRLKLFESFLDEELSRVFDVVGIVNDSIVDVVPVPAFFVETIDFVSDSSCFETAFVQVVRTTHLDG